MPQTQEEQPGSQAHRVHRIDQEQVQAQPLPRMAAVEDNRTARVEHLDRSAVAAAGSRDSRALYRHYSWNKPKAAAVAGSRDNRAVRDNSMMPVTAGSRAVSPDYNQTKRARVGSGLHLEYIQDQDIHEHRL